jgi:hypothetical protein
LIGNRVRLPAPIQEFVDPAYNTFKENTKEQEVGPKIILKAKRFIIKMDFED